MAPPESKKVVSKGEVASVYYFYGDNAFLIDKAVTDIKTAFFPSKDPGMGLEGFDAQTHGPSVILNSVRTLPFGTPKKLVIVQNAHTFKAEQVEKFGSYFSGPSKHACLVFTAEKMIFKGKLLTALKKSGKAEKFENPKSYQSIKPYITEAFKNQGRRISADALQFMNDNIGNDLSVIRSEVEKIVLFCGSKKSVDLKDVEGVLSAGSRNDIFNLVEAVGNGDIQKSVLLLGTLISGGTHPLQILTMISRQFKQISIAVECDEKNISRSDLGKKIGVYSDFLIKKVNSQARGWDSRSLGKVFDEIFAVNYRLKSSRVEGKVIMEDLIFRLVQLRNQSYA